MQSAHLQLRPDFPDVIARAGRAQHAFARRAGVSVSTIMGLVHPEIHPGRRGGMQRRTAWLLANAYAELVGVEPEDAFKTFIVEHDLTPSPGA